MKCFIFKTLVLFISIKVYSLETATNLGFAGVGSVNASSPGLNMELNPAALSLDADLSFGAGGVDGQRPEGVDHSGYYAFVKDSLSSYFPSRKNFERASRVGSANDSSFSASFFYDKRKTDLGNQTSYQLSVSKVLSKNLSLGGSTRYTDGSLMGKTLQKWSVDVASVYRLTNSLNVGLSWLNLNSSNSLEERLRFGLGYSAHKLINLFFDADYSLDQTDDEMSVGFGAEARIKRFFSLRSGYFSSGGDRPDFLGLGVSFMGPRLQVHYGAKIDQETQAALHSVDFSLPL